MFAYSAKNLWRIEAPDTPSNHKNRITERCSSLVHTETGAAMINDKVAMMELT